MTPFNSCAPLNPSKENYGRPGVQRVPQEGAIPNLRAGRQVPIEANAFGRPAAICLSLPALHRVASDITTDALRIGLIQISPRGGASTGSIHSGSGPVRLGRRPARYAPTKKQDFYECKGKFLVTALPFFICPLASNSTISENSITESN